jgi:hypothetical protein
MMGFHERMTANNNSALKITQKFVQHSAKSGDGEPSGQMDHVQRN